MAQRFTFDFDQWAALSRSDPQAFEHLRAQVIDAYCQEMEPQHRPWLDSIRWRIDMERARARSPLQCCLKLSSLMWDRFFDLNEMLQTGKTPLENANRSGRILYLKNSAKTKK